MDAFAIAGALGLIVGLVLALTGAGGGVIAIPLLVFGLHLSVQQAAPVGLVAVGLAAALGAALGLSQGIVRYRAAGLIGLAGMSAAPLGVIAAQHLPNRPLLAAFAVVLIYTAFRMLRTTADATPNTENIPCRVEDGAAHLIWTRQCARALFGTGLVSGFLSGLLGVGGGFVIVPALRHHTDLSLRSVQATSLAVIALVSISSVSAAALQGSVPWAIGVPFTGGALTGLLSGRQFSKKVNPKILQSAFAWFALFVAMLMLARAIGWLQS
jgi:uncharacterized membrane protein YfcA